MKASETEQGAAPAATTAREPAQEHVTGALAAGHTSAGLLMALQRSVGNAAVSQLVTQTAPAHAIQRGVYAESGAKSVAVPGEAKAHATWVMARDGPGGRLDNMVVPQVLQPGTPYQRTIHHYEKYKGRWYVGHMIFGNLAQPDGNRLPVADTYREYDVHESDAPPWPPPPAQLVKKRDAERIVIGQASRRRWYTNNHYADFTEFS